MNTKSSYGRHNLIIGYVILFSFLLSAITFHNELSKLRQEVQHVGAIPKIKITDTEQFSTLCNQFTRQWGGKHYAFYILQPNSTFKTHKEKTIVSEEITDSLPNRTPITTEKLNLLLDGSTHILFEEGGLDTVLPGNQLSEKYNTIVIPIKQSDVLVGELYIFYDKGSDMRAVDAHVTEAQLLTQLLY